jgi:integrase/recombinase XerC
MPAGSFRLPRYFTQPELQQFFAVIADPRDRALFALIYHYGLRVGEVALLERRDIDLVRSRIVVKRLKGGAWAERPLFASTCVLLQRLSDGQRDAPLFTGRRGPLRKRQIQSRFSRYRDRAGLRRDLTCHSLRHSIATHLLDAGVSLEFVQDHLGHQNIRSTSVYARITDRHRAAVFQMLEASPWIVDPTQSELPPLSAPPKELLQ